jgi:SAM-dependent MidA family methyltransferase
MATLDGSLARGVARWIQKNGARDVIEIGAGSGQLARDILTSLGWWKRLRLRYHIVEVSTPLREAQKKLLRGRRVTWHETLPAALEATSGRAHIFSNELVDAFPCRVFELTPTGWLELHLKLEGGRLREILMPCELPESTIFQHPASIGQRVEVHESYRDWLQAWIPGWKSGSMLTIDYGDTMPMLYHRRPAGSLRGYAAHQVLSGADIYQAPGRCDITADVNFSDLEAWGEKTGLRKISHSNLADFLSPPLPARFQSAAEAFRVLEQTRDGKIA